MNTINRSRLFSYAKCIVALLLLLICLAACSNVSGQIDDSTSVEELEREKLALEVEQLRLEQQFFVLNKWIGIIGGLLGSVAVLWTIAQGYRTLKHQIENQRALRIAELLSNLSDQRIEVRVGAVRGLSRYTDTVLGEILSALKLEKAPQVREALIDILSRVDGKQLLKIIAANTDTIPARCYYLGRLGQVGAGAEYADALLRLSPFSRRLVKEEHRFQYDHGRRFQRQRLQRAESLQESEVEENSMLVVAAAQEARLAEGTSQVIAQSFREGRKPKNLKAALDLSSTNLYKVDLSDSNLSNSLLSGSLMRHICLDNSEMERCDVSYANLFGASLNEVDFSEAILVGSQLRSSSAQGAKFRRGNLEEATLSEGDFRQTDLCEVNAKKAKFRATNLQNALLDSSKLNEAEFHQADLQNASLRGVKCYGASLVEANFTGASLVGAKFGGADLRGAILRNADLRNADFSGADVSQADFRGANVTGASFRKTRNVESAKFDPDVELAVL